MRGLRAIMMRLAKGETAMLIEIWRTNLRWGSMQAADALRQSLEAEMRAGQLSAAVKQLQMVIAGMMRGAKGMALQSMRSTMAEDERQRCAVDGSSEEFELVETPPRTTCASVADAIYKNIKQLEAVFRLMDVDDSGALSMDEFTQACEVINRVSEGAAVLSTEQIQDLAEQMDQDKDGVISYNEFLESMRNHRLA